MRLPEVASRIRQIAGEHGIAELARLADHIGRRRSTRAPNKSRTMTDELRAEIRDYAEAHPRLTQLEIGNHFGVNPGRVSEALRGKRT